MILHSPNSKLTTYSSGTSINSGEFGSVDIPVFYTPAFPDGAVSLASPGVYGRPSEGVWTLDTQPTINDLIA
jgi:hypothetical protein